MAIGAAMAIVGVIVGIIVGERYFRRHMAIKPPSTPAELEDDRLATEGYVRGPGGGPPIAAPAPRAPIAAVSSPIVPSAEVDAPEFVVRGTHQAQAITCPQCGGGWWMQAYSIVTGPRRAERLPGASPVWICASCYTVFQEHPPNTFQRLEFRDGVLRTTD